LFCSNSITLDQITALEPDHSIKEIYHKPFKLAYVITLEEHQLSTDLHIINPSPTEPLEFQALLHTYIRAPANDVSITPLKGKLFIDKTESDPAKRKVLKEEKRSIVDVRAYTDSVYEDTPQNVTVSWPGGGIELRLREFQTLTVWNPQNDVGSKIGDMESGGW
jgi:glucose-6-phosphate 1-epimerase